jgi:hypothetical protein
MDETSMQVKGEWRYGYRAGAKPGQTIEFLLTAQRDEAAALRFLTKAIRRHGGPEKITIDGSAAHDAAIKSDHEEHGPAIVIRKITSLNTIVAQDQRGVKRVTRPMLGFKAFGAAQGTLAGLELLHLLRKKQLVVEAGKEGLTAAAEFDSLAALSPHRQGQLPRHDLLTKMCDKTVPFAATTHHSDGWHGVTLVRCWCGAYASLSSATSHRPWRTHRPSASPVHWRSGGRSGGTARQPVRS